MSPRGTKAPSLGALERTVRWIEEVDRGRFDEELPKKLAKLSGEKLDAWLRAAAVAALRSIRTPIDDGSRFPHSWLVLPSVRSLVQSLEATGGEDAARLVSADAVKAVRGEIDAEGGPLRLPDYPETPGAKEDILFSFLEEVRAGHPDAADERFCLLARDLEKGPLLDLVFSAGLEGVTREVHKVVGVVEGTALLQWLGWDWSSVVLRPVVRHQSSGSHGMEEYERCRAEVEGRDLFRAARRRPPGQPSLGERDARAFFREAESWAEGDGDQRRLQLADALAQGQTLEDLGEVVGLGATLLYLQSTLRQVTQRWTRSEADARMHLVTGPEAMTKLVRLGTPGQRVLGLLLAGYLPGVREARLSPRSPDCGWWLPTAARIVEAPQVECGKESTTLEAWSRSISDGKPTGLLPLITTLLEEGGSAERLIAGNARAGVYRDVDAGRFVKLERTLAEAYRATRSPHRWLHVWAAGLAGCLWPERRTQDLQPVAPLP